MIRILPQGPQGPVQQAVQGPSQQVEPLRDQTGNQMQQLGQGVQSLATGMTRLAASLQDDLVVARSADYRNRLSDVVTKKLYGPDGFLTRVGANASPYERAKAVTEIRQEGVKLLGGLESAAEKQNLTAAMEQMLGDADKVTMRHLATQALNYKAASLEVSVNRSMDQMVRGAGTEEGDFGRKAMEDDIELLGRTLGWDSKMVEAEKKAKYGEAHEQVLASIIENPDLAGSYLKAHTNEISPKRAEWWNREVQKGLVTKKRAADDEFSQAIADEMDAEELTHEDAEAKLKDMQARGEIDLAVRDGARERFRTLQENRRARTAQSTVALVRQAEDFATANRATVRRYEELPASIRTELEASGAANSMRLFLERGGQRITTARGADFMADMTANPSRMGAFKTVDEMQAALLNDLSIDDMQKASKAWGDLQAGQPKDGMDDGDATSYIYRRMRDDEFTPMVDPKDPLAKQVAEDERARFRQAVEMEAKAEFGDKWRSQTALDKAYKTLAGQKIRDAAGRSVPSAMLSKPQLDQEGVGYETPLGFVRAGALSKDVVEEIIGIIEFENSILPPNSDARQSIDQMGVATRFRRQQMEEDSIITNTVSKHWTHQPGGWWNSQFGYSRSRYYTAKDEAEKAIMDELNQRKIPFTLDDIRRRM